jgi:hypothetical protein
MSRSKQASPALVIAILALIAALVGSAVADSGPKANTSASVAKTVKQAQKKAATALRKAKRVLRIARKTSKRQGPAGNPGSQGAIGDSGSRGEKGDTGPAGTALAYARITDTGAIDTTHSRGLGSATVTHPSTGHYCIEGLPFTPNNAVATPQNFPTSLLAFISPIAGCGANTQVSVATVSTMTGNFGDSSFMILLN